MTNNSINTNTTGQTGTGLIVGSNSPSFSGSLNIGGASSLKIPNSASPVLSSSGDIAIDTSIPNFDGMIKYHDVTSEYTVIGLPFNNLSAVDNNVVSYDSASSEFIMREQDATGLVNYAISVDTSNVSTTSTSFVNTPLTISITPLYADSMLFIRGFLYGQSQANPSIVTKSQMLALYIIRRSTGTAATLINVGAGRQAEMPVTSGDPSYYPMLIAAQEVAGDTNVHTYTVRYRNIETGVITNIFGNTFASIMVVYEMRV